MNKCYASGCDNNTGFTHECMYGDREMCCRVVCDNCEHTCERDKPCERFTRKSED